MHIADQLSVFEAERASLMALLNGCEPHEVICVLAQLRAGAVVAALPDYCLIGSIATSRGQTYERCGLRAPDFEVWFATMDTETTDPLIEQWLVAWLDERTLELPQRVESMAQ
jgi:hypothetical protein